MSLAEPHDSATKDGDRRVSRWLTGCLKVIIGVVLCMTPVSALIVLGWLTRKTSRDIASRLNEGRSAQWPNFVIGEAHHSGSLLERWAGALWDNLMTGARALGVVAVWTLPFGLAWLSGWLSGWETSFSKAYESAGVWPVASLLAVAVSLPIYTLLPMAIAHQAADGRFASGFELGVIWRTVRRAGLGYVGLTALFTIGAVGVFGARGLPTFAEHFSPLVKSGEPELIAQHANRMRLFLTALLFVGLIVTRHVMARVYSRAMARGAATGWIKPGFVVVGCCALWLAAIFLVYAAQFLNYSPWFWLNQPHVGLPWIGSY